MLPMNPRVSWSRRARLAHSSTPQPPTLLKTLMFLRMWAHMRGAGEGGLSWPCCCSGPHTVIISPQKSLTQAKKRARAPKPLTSKRLCWGDNIKQTSCLGLAVLRSHPWGHKETKQEEVGGRRSEQRSVLLNDPSSTSP